MSIKTFLNRIWNNIRLLFTNFPTELKSAVSIAITVTDNIKTFVDSPIADILTAIIPGDVDDRIKQLLRGGIPVILTNLKLVDDCGDLKEPQMITNCAVKVLQNMDGEIKSAFLHTISVMVAQLAADGKLGWSDGVCIVEWYYKHKYKAVTQ